MKCEKCREVLEEYFDDALDGEAARSVQMHLESCSSCANAFQLIASEQRVYDRYHRDIDVSPMLWASIQRRIQNERVEHRTRPFDFVRGWVLWMRAAHLNPAMVAAILVLAIGLTIIVTTYVQRPRPTESARTVTPEQGTPSNSGGGSIDGKDAGKETPENNIAAKPGDNPAPRVPRNQIVANAKPSAAQLVREAEQKYLTAIAILSKDVNRRKNTLEPESRTRFETALAIIDNTIDETRQAARKNPNDPVALQYLLASYSKKIDLLREMARE
jgi:hypothetical protein